MKKRVFVIIGAIVLVVVIVALNLMQQKKGKDVEVEIVKRGDIISKVTSSGIVRAKSQVDISSETIGRIEKVYFQEGEHVRKGDLLIELDDVNADASRKLARAQLHQAEQDFVRGEKLYEKELISQESFEKIQLSYETAKAQYEQAVDSYQKTKIYAPISGKIMKINVEEGETAVMGTMNYQGTVLMTVADMSRVIAVVRIDETDVPDVEVGQTVEVVVDALPDSVYPGEVTKIGLMPITSQLSTETVTDFEVEIELNEFSPVLRPGMNVKADIITSQKSDVVVIPIQAAGKREIDDTTAQTVFVVKENKAHLKKITLGVSSDTETEVISGVDEGDTVIIGPYRLLSTLEDGDPINFEITADDTTAQSVRPRRLFRALRKRS